MGIDRRELDKFNRRWEDLYEEFPAARAAAVAAMGRAVKEELDERILSQGVDDMFGHIRNAQQIRLGDKGGYAAVSPVADGMTDRFGRVKTWKGKQVSTRQVTRWLERGHAARKPGSDAKRYSPRIKKAGISNRGTAYVPGRMFYSYTRMRALSHALTAAEKCLDELSDRL